MEPIRLHGKERHEWERHAISRHGRSRQLVLRVLLDLCAGKAECWPSNRMIADTIGIKPRAVQLILRALEAAGAIRCVEDDSRAVQRRVIVLGHPGAQAALKKQGGANRCAPGVKGDARGRSRISKGAQSGASEVLNEQEKEKPVAGPADHGPAGDQAEDDWLARMSPALRARFQGAIDELSKES